MFSVNQIFNHQDFFKNYNQECFSVKKIESVIENLLEERLDFFSKKIENKVVQKFNEFSFNELKIIGDLEKLPFKNKSIDLVLNLNSLLITNDIPGVLKQWHSCLKTGGIFMGAFLGSDTLKELKSCFYEACENININFCTRFLPMVQTKDAGMLMYRSGFANPTADVTRLKFYVQNIQEIFTILRNMGGNCCYENSKNHPINKKLLQKVASIYERSYSTPEGLQVTVEVICITGWVENFSENQIKQQKTIKLMGNA